MKKYLFVAVAVVLSAIMFSCKKEDSQNPDQPVTPETGGGYYLYGYCDKENVDGGIGNSGNVTFQVATQFPGSELTAKGTQIAGVRFYVEDGAESGSIWVANTLGTRIAEKEFTVEDAGWQYVMFDTPVNVNAENDFYVGYEASGSGYFLGYNEVKKKGSVNWVLDDSEWVTLTSISMNNYTFSIEAIMQGGDYSGEVQHDYKVIACDFPDNLRANDKVDFSVSVASFGIKTTGKLTVTCTCGTDVLTGSVSGLRNGESKTLDFTLEAASASMTKVEFEIAEDGVSEKGTSSKDVKVYAADAPYRNCILIEEFTSQSCPNCPSGIATLREAIAGMKDPSKAAWIAHHSGYVDDAFTQQGDLDIADKFGVNAAPQCMIDRTKVDYGTGTAELVWHPGYATSALLDKMAAIPADAEIGLNVNMDEFSADSTITVTVTGKCAKSAYVTIVICQDSIIANQSSGGSNFVHGEAVRGYLTESLGNELTRESDGSFSTTVSYRLPSFIYEYKGKKGFATDVDNMFIVAFVHGQGKAAVYNAAKVELKNVMR